MGQRRIRVSIMPILFNSPLCNGSNQIYVAPLPPLRRPPRPPVINLGMYNIRYGYGFGLPQAIRAVHFGNYDLMLLTETNIPDME